MRVRKTKTEVVKQNVGIDISKADFKVCFFHLDSNGRKSIKGTRTYKNTAAGFEQFHNWICKKIVIEIGVHITLEATGVYYENLTYFLVENNYLVSVLLPNQSKAFAMSLNLKTKTDKVDARMLGQMGIERDLPKWLPLSDNMRILKQLTRDRVSLLDEKTALSNKLHALNHSYKPENSVIKRLKQHQKLIIKQLSQVEKEIRQNVEKDEVLNQKIANICMVKGLGIITVATIVAETNGFVLFTSRSQLISYAGYDVVQRESGSSIKGKTRISKKGNRFIRRALHFPAITMVKHEQQYKQLFERILDRTSIKMKGYVAVQRKALILIYTLFKNNEPYNPNYENKIEGNIEQVTEKCRQDINPAYSGCLS